MKPTNSPSFVLRIWAAGFLGAAIFSLLVHLCYMKASPQVIYDGQYAMVFMLTAPIGWLIGGGLFGAYVLANLQADRPDHAVQQFGCAYLLGLVLMPFVAIWCIATMASIFNWK